MKWLSKSVLGAALIAGGLLAAPAAEAATCSRQVQSYTVQTGDTLSQISQAVFGDAGSWPLIYEYPGNARLIGRNPNVLGVGSRLQIPPCPGSVAALPTNEEIRQVSAGARNNSRLNSIVPTIIYIAVHKHLGPFAAADWPQGGMATMVVRAAFEAVGMGDQIRIHHIGDWNAQFRDLLPTNRYQLGIGWSMPDMTYWKTCDRLPQKMQIRCNYNISEPTLTMTLGFFYEVGRADLQNATFERIKEARLCRPDGWSTFQLEENGIPLDNLVTPPTLDECFRMLLAGTVDFVVEARLSSLSTATKMGIRDRVDMATFTGVPFGFYMVAHKENPQDATQYLEAFNEGLKIIIDNGIYGQITSFYNDEFARRLQSN